MRPPELSTDTASVADAALHAIDWYEREKAPLDGLLLLQPTSPFRSRRSIQAAIGQFELHQRRPVIGLSPVKAHPAWCYYLEDGTVKPFLADGGIHKRSQDLGTAYVVNGAIYLISPADLRKHRSFYSDDMVPLVMEHPADAVDIDTEWDWRMTEATLELLQLDERLK
jgi:N-acylneuraminate cytidylyltransferase